MNCVEHLAQCLILQCQISTLHLRKMQTKGVSAKLIELAWVFEIGTQQMHLSKWKLLFRTWLSVGGNATVLADTDSHGLISATCCSLGCWYKVRLRYKLRPFPAPLCRVQRWGLWAQQYPAHRLWTALPLNLSGTLKSFVAPQWLSHRFERSNGLFG